MIVIWRRIGLFHKSLHPTDLQGVNERSVGRRIGYLSIVHRVLYRLNGVNVMSVRVHLSALSRASSLQAHD
jgi:hypothetical protein